MSVEDAEAGLARVTAELDISEGINPDVIQKYKRLSSEVNLAHACPLLQRADW